MKLLKLPSNTLARVNGRNYYLSNKDPRIMMIEGKNDDSEIEDILSYNFLKKIDENFSANERNEIFFCGSRFPSTIIAKYLKKEIKGDTFRSLVNGWRNGTRNCDNLDQLEKLKEFLDNNTPVVENGLVYVSNNELPDFGDIPVVIAKGDLDVFKGQHFKDFISQYYPEASKKFINRLISKTFIHGKDLYLSHLYLSAFEPIFGWDKVVHLVINCTVTDKWKEEKFEKVKKFVEEIKFKKNSDSFFNLFKKSGEINLDFVDATESLEYWSRIDFDKIKSTKDIDYIIKYMKLLEKPNRSTNYNLDHQILKEPFIKDYYLVLPRTTHELALFGFEMRNCMAEGGYNWKNTIIGVLKKNKKFHAALHFGDNCFQYRLKHNAEPDKDEKMEVQKKVNTIKYRELFIKEEK